MADDFLAWIERELEGCRFADERLLRRGDQGENRIASSVDAPEPRMIASSECSRCLILVLPLPHDYPSSGLPLLPQRPAYGRLRFATP